MTYFILINNQQQGPYTIDELRQRGITQESLVWAEGMPQWTPAWQVEELKPLFFQSSNNGFNGEAGNSTPGSTTPPPPPTTPAQGTGAAFASANGGGSDSFNGTVTPDSPKPKSHKKLYICLGVVVVILFILALTNPSKIEHRQAILQKLDNATEQLDDNVSDPMEKAVIRSIMGLGQGMINQYIKELVDSDLEYHNYIFFSTTSLHSDILKKDIRTSSGVLGHVNAVSLSNVMPDIIFKEMTGSDPSDDATHEEETSTETTQDADGNETTVTTQTVKHNGVTVDSLTKKVTSRIADEVAKKVKHEVNQQTDSATASGINGIINDIVNLIKGL